MLYTGFFKRIIPFGLTFGAGLLIASIFIPIGLPNLDSWAEARRSRDCHRKRQLIKIQRENYELREEVRSLRTQNDDLRRSAEDIDEFDFSNAVPPVELPEHKPPPPPKRPKHPRNTVIVR